MKNMWDKEWRGWMWREGEGEEDEMDGQCECGLEGEGTVGRADA